MLLSVYLRGVCAGKETPNNLRIKVNLSIGSPALILVGSDSTSELLRAGLDNLKSVVNMYPDTLEVLAAVQVSFLDEPHCLLLSPPAGYSISCEAMWLLLLGNLQQ